MLGRIGPVSYWASDNRGKPACLRDRSPRAMSSLWSYRFPQMDVDINEAGARICLICRRTGDDNSDSDAIRPS